jgi:UDP-N-acetylglucosamine 2-epimerase
MASALARKKYNIPTLACSNALDTGNARSLMRHLQADKIAAMGKRIKDIYIASGLERDRIVVTGVAHFDHLFNRDKERDSQVLLGCNVALNKRIIVFTTDNISVSETEQMLNGVINAVLKIEDIQLVIKVHPREEIAIYQAVAEKYHDSRIIVVKDVDLYALISNCELLITKYSTTALEAMMSDKPVVTINLSGEPDPVPYATEGAAIGVYHYQDIEPAILKALYDEETRSRLKAGRDEFVRNWAGEPDGKASQRIVMLMKEMIGASAKHSKGVT